MDPQREDAGPGQPHAQHRGPARRIRRRRQGDDREVAHIRLDGDGRLVESEGADVGRRPVVLLVRAIEGLTAAPA